MVVGYRYPLYRVGMLAQGMPDHPLTGATQRLFVSKMQPRFDNQVVRLGTWLERIARRARREGCISINFGHLPHLFIRPSSGAFSANLLGSFTTLNPGPTHAPIPLSSGFALASASLRASPGN